MNGKNVKPCQGQLFGPAAAAGSAFGRRTALLATQSILLGAHAPGLGSCLLGCTVAAMRKGGRIREALNIPREETVHAVVAPGHPAVAYPRRPGRRRREVGFVES